MRHYLKFVLFCVVVASLTPYDDDDFDLLPAIPALSALEEATSDSGSRSGKLDNHQFVSPTPTNSTSSVARSEPHQSSSILDLACTRLC